MDVEPVDADLSVTVAHEVIGDLDRSLERLARLAPLAPERPADLAAGHRARFQAALGPPATRFAPHHARTLAPPHFLLDRFFKGG